MTELPTTASAARVVKSPVIPAKIEAHRAGSSVWFYLIIGDLLGYELGLGVVFSVPAALVLGLLAGLIAWAVPRQVSFLRSIGAGAGLGIAAGLVGAAVSWLVWDAWDNPANAVDYVTVSIVYWTIIGLLNVGEVAAVIYVARRIAKVGQSEASA